MSIEPRRVVTAAESEIASRFAARVAEEPAAITRRREAAIAALARDGLPNRRVEAYRYTDLKAAVRAFHPAAAPADAAQAETAFARAFAGLSALDHRIVFVDGHYSPALSRLATLDGAVTVSPLAPDLLADSPHAQAVGHLADGVAADPVVALNTAFFGDGTVIHVAPDATIAKTVAIVHIATGSAPASTHVRHVVTIGRGATVRFFEQHAGAEAAERQSNTVVELDIGPRAQVAWARLQEEGLSSLHLGSLVVRLGEAAEFDHLSVVFGAGLSRHQGFVTFAGPHARAGFETVTLIDGRRQADATLVVNHAVPDCVSRERFRAVIDDEARSIVQGRINVAPQAQRTDGRMMTQALVIGEGAESINKPELEIFADDVQCAHGATSGRLDPQAVFYLRSRGLPRREAEALLVEAFLAEALVAFPDEALAEALAERLRARLAARGAEVAA
ncbi:Fe-S cluster assembly protein SufD [Segnochrobactrum spirostomi]|uniref:Fe-S cluster assembly protein SufD n=1 Tax=Segnochrobactrum spirostomi TaxID=2608987 RepID=A0A6A7Y5U0_9HYPH|nr:Fe-S cluster assembly protein SufD [Segnochrobactrum spirostomi]MQT14603.1 Fe-S cluster assembly protein SufD [Segnochrobactrum spirostomi]